MTHILAPLFMALCALGAFRAMGEGMVLSAWYEWWATKPAWIAKPLATCPRCMVSAWGIPCAMLTFDINPLWLPAYLLAAVSIQEVIDK
jgi:hypothetical protein